MTQWHFKFVGWPWWVVLPLAALAAWAMWRWLAPELSLQPSKLRRVLLALRCTAVGLVVLLLLEPTLSKTSRVRELPLVAVLVDQSGSMLIEDRASPASDQLAEAVALGLVPTDQRPRLADTNAQVQADARLVEQAQPDSALAKALAAWRQMTRFDRAARLAQTKILPALTNRARVKVFAVDQDLRPLDSARPPKLIAGQATDFEGPLAALSRQWAQENVGGILLLSDGRQTAGRDPAPVVRALRARGASLAAIRVGDPREPPDAAVAEVVGSSDVFLDEPISLDVKYRVKGEAPADWDLVLSQGGKELERHTVKGSGQWQYEHFETPAKQPGVAILQARIEPHTGRVLEGAPERPAGSITREIWNNLPGSQIADLTNSGALSRKPDRVETLSALDAPRNVGENFGSRIRGWLFPPATGSFTFWIASDDASELWLSRTGDPKDKALVASVGQYTPPLNWDATPSQRSMPIALQTGQPCYLEVLHKEGSGENHVAVGWQLPDGAMERPIPGKRLAPWPSDGMPRAAPAALAATNRFEEATLANNQSELAVAVNQDPIRVFLADATPRWETRYLAAMFERDRRVKLERHYQSIMADQPGAPLLPKSQSEWDKQDLVVLGDLDSTLLTPQQQQFCANYVAKRGGFLVCVAGPRGMPRSFSLGAMANVLPVRVTGQAARDAAPVSLTLVEENKDHPITSVLKDPAFNVRLWPALPPLQWIAGSVSPKPGATILLEAQNPTRTPIVALQRYGAGRVLWMGTGESWRWRDRLGDRVHHTFWLQAMRWGLASRLRGSDPRLQVGLDRALLSPGASAELRGRATTRSGSAVTAPLQVKLEQLDAQGAVVPESVRAREMKAIPDSNDLWQHTLADLPEGPWRVTVTSPHADLAGLSEVREFLVRSESGQELLDLSADAAALARLAEMGGGQAGGVEQADPILRRFADQLKPQVRDQARTYSLWDNYLVLVLIAGLLAAEWMLRKRVGLP